MEDQSRIITSCDILTVISFDTGLTLLSLVIALLGVGVAMYFANKAFIMFSPETRKVVDFNSSIPMAARVRNYDYDLISVVFCERNWS
jgi:hypothetical protein